MAILLIIGYVFLFTIWIFRTDYFKIEGLSKPFLFIAFLIKIAAGILYGFIHYDYFQGGDTSSYFNESHQIYNTFSQYPNYYFCSIFGWTTPVPNDPDIFIYPESAIFWKDLGTYVLVHVHAFLHLFTGGDYSVHVVFMAFLGLFSSLNFYAVFRSELAIPKKHLIAVCFFMPSLLFWTSGLHKDVLIYWGLSLVVLAISSSARRWLLLATGLLIVGLFRHYLLVLLLPAVVGYYWAKQNSEKTWLRFAMLYAGLFVMAVILQAAGFPFLEIMVKQQQAFSSEVGNSSFAMVPLHPIWSDFIYALPNAIFNVSMRPTLWECFGFWQLLAAIEILSVLTLLVVSIFFSSKLNWQKPLVAFLTFYAVTNLLLVGLLVANTGTIVRYRAIALSFLVVVLLQGLDYLRLRHKNNKARTLKPIPMKDMAAKEVELDKMRA